MNSDTGRKRERERELNTTTTTKEDAQNSRNLCTRACNNVVMFLVVVVVAVA